MENQLFKAERRHKFIMWTVVGLCALFSLLNIVAAASGGRIGQMFSDYMANHESFAMLVKSTGLYGFLADSGSTVSSTGKEMLLSMGLGQLVMIGISLILIYLAIAKGFEPLLLIPIGFGGLLSNAPGAGVSEVMNIIGDVAGQDCILVDDIVDSAGTLCNAAVALTNAGAKSVHAYVTHGVLSGEAVKRVTDSPLESLVITDTIAPTQAVLDAKNIRIVSVAELVGESILRISEERSVTSLFY